MEDALHFIESELTLDLRNRVFDFIVRVKLAILQDFLQYSKEPRAVGPYVW
jgi:hypothetical protein